MTNTQKAALAIFRSLDAETRTQMLDIMRAMVTQQEKQRSALYKAIEHAPIDCISRGIEILKGATILGEPVMSMYGHVTKAMQDDAANKLQAVILGRK